MGVVHRLCYVCSTQAVLCVQSTGCVMCAVHSLCYVRRSSWPARGFFMTTPSSSVTWQSLRCDSRWVERKVLVTACAGTNMECCTWGWQFLPKHQFGVEAFTVLECYAAVLCTLCCKPEISQWFGLRIFGWDMVETCLEYYSAIFMN
jgi:hypothetical protein